MYTKRITAGSQRISPRWMTNNATQMPSAMRFSRRISMKVFLDSNRLIASMSGRPSQIGEGLAARQYLAVAEESVEDRDHDPLDHAFGDRVHDPGHARDAEVPRDV